MRPRVGRVAASPALAGHLIEQEVGEREVGEGPVEVDEAERPVVARVETALVVAQELPAELDRVTAGDPGHLLVDLIRLGEGVRVERVRSRQREPAAPSDRAEPVDRLPAGNPILGIGGADAGPVERLRSDGGTAVTDEQFVDHRRADHAVPAEADVVERLVVSRGEHERKRLSVPPVLIQGERIAAEELVVVRRAPVHAHVALMGAYRQQCFADIVPGQPPGHGAVRQRVVHHIVQDRAGGRADSACRNLVAGKRKPREGIANLGADAREVAAAPRFWSH